jgi:hypothetical protein
LFVFARICVREGLVKVSKFLVVVSLFSLALLVFLVPAFNVVAQTSPTATPEVVIITATPSGDTTQAGAATTDASLVGTADANNSNSSPSDTPVIQAVKAGETALAKQLSTNYLYIKQHLVHYTYDTAQAKDCTILTGTRPVAGDVFGWIIGITYAKVGGNVTATFFTTFNLSSIYACNPGGVAAAAGPAVAGHVVAGPFEAGAQILNFGSGTVARLNTAKLKWIKLQLAPSDPNSAADITAAHNQGFKILMSVVGGVGEVLNSGYFAQYAAYVGTVAGQGADAIEVWNEENLDRQWPNGHIDPASYTQLLAASFTAIKAANPNTIVISGALSPTGGAPGNGQSAAFWNDDVYYQGMAAAGAAKYMDCVGIHYNEGIVAPNATSGDSRDNYPTRYFATMMARALGPFGGTKGCFTEIGYLTPQGYPALPGGFAWAQNTTLAQQAQWISGAAVLASQSGNIRLMIIFNMDFVRYDSDPQAGYAMIRPDGTCPACDALAGVLN